MIEQLYASYLKEMKRLKATPPFMSIKQFADSQGIMLEEEVEPLVLTPRKAQLPMKPTLTNHIKAEGQAPRKKYVETEAQRLAKVENMRQRRANFIAQGLNSKGKPYKVAV